MTPQNDDDDKMAEHRDRKSKQISSPVYLSSPLAMAFAACLCWAFQILHSVDP